MAAAIFLRHTSNSQWDDACILKPDTISRQMKTLKGFGGAGKVTFL